MPQTRCPYSTNPLVNSMSVNQEHIVPAALGGPDNFTVPAETHKNSELNYLIDAPATNDPLLRFYATSQGVTSHSGPVTSQIQGTVDGSEESVRATFSVNGLDVRFTNPVDVDGNTGFVSGVRGFGNTAEKHALEIQKKYEKKGLQISLSEPEARENPTINLRFSGDLSIIRQELIKIAYLMTVRVFGDDAILSPAGEIYRTAMLAKTEEAIDATGLRGNALAELPAHGFPRPARNQHALTCFCLGGMIVSSVTLFGTFNGLFVTSTDGFSEADGHGEIAIIDASTSRLRTWPYLKTISSVLQNGVPTEE